MKRAFATGHTWAWTAFVSLALSMSFAASVAAQATIEPLAAFDSLLTRYRTADGVRYQAWANSPADRRRLTQFVDQLERATPDSMTKPAALAYWINLYNAATLELVLAHCPLQSIRDIPGPPESPWDRLLVTVQGQALSLDAIENEILRPQFRDPRIHFALNCAARSCPLLAARAFRAAELDAQLDAACDSALADPRWLHIEKDRILLSKLFEWYREDFERNGASVLSFLARYRQDAKALQADSASVRIEYLEYDWSLNLSR